MRKFRDGNEEVDVPTVAAFLDEYEALCRKHGMRHAAEYAGDCAVAVSVAPFDGDMGELGIDDLGSIDQVPEAAAIKDRRTKAYYARLKRDRAAIAATAPDDPVVALEMARRYVNPEYNSDPACLVTRTAIDNALAKLRRE